VGREDSREEGQLGVVGQKGGRTVSHGGTVGWEDGGAWWDSGEGEQWSMVGQLGGRTVGHAGTLGTRIGRMVGSGGQWGGIRGKVGGTNCEHFKMRFFKCI